jgi:predicted thioesterase
MLDISTIYSVGMTMESSFIVGVDDTYGNCSSRLNMLMSTPGSVARMIDLVGKKCNELLPEGFVTVGIRFAINQVAAAMMGTRVTLKATIEAIEGNKLIIALEIRDDLGGLAWGQNERAVLPYMALLDAAEKRTKQIRGL